MWDQSWVRVVMHMLRGESFESNETGDINSSLGNEGILGAGSENKEVRNIKAWYRKYKGKKKNQREGENKVNNEGPKVVCRRTRHVCFDPHNPIPYLELGMVFRGSEKFKTALAKYEVKKRSDIVYLRNERGRNRARCREDGCLLEYMLL
ncbi:hypothetical protein PVK06_039080 [Gossypium arboreum]|uniref:Transposase MuDR plant domain-containing protein n=1 Tax=Gossypium arboreum TaxID=29729 RepID=A0ABR0N1Y3_GOSAR|nr:hypothetical protein PVK06_039080 [Gossypium arboreum]